MGTTYPTLLDEHVLTLNDLDTVVVFLETIVGVTNSTDPNSLTYKIANVSGGNVNGGTP